MNYLKNLVLRKKMRVMKRIECPHALDRVPDSLYYVIDFVYEAGIMKKYGIRSILQTFRMTVNVHICEFSTNGSPSD